MPCHAFVARAYIILLLYHKDKPKDLFNVIKIEVILKICYHSFMAHKYLLFGDNIWEARSVADEIVKQLGPESGINLISEIHLNGCPSLATYSFKYKDNNISITCLGNYSLWVSSFPIVQKYIDFFDKPDVVLYSENQNKILAAGEFTETVQVGNSQWQRAQRFVSAIKLNIPFLAVYGFGEDRSQSTLREANALLAYSYLKLSCDYSTPAFLIFKDSLYLFAHNKRRTANGLDALVRPDGNKIIGEWFGLRLLNSIESQGLLIDKENEMYNHMFDSLYYNVKKSSRILRIVNNDIPKYPEKIGDNVRDLQIIKNTPFKDLCHYQVNVSGSIANSSYFKTNVYPMIKDLFKTYKKGAKFGISDKENTESIEEMLLNKYPPNPNQIWQKGLFNYSKPIVLIPLQMWQAAGYSDPNGGEAVLFPSLLDSIDYNSTANIVYIFFGIAPENWYSNFNANNQKIYRAVNTIGKLLCVDNNGNSEDPESFKIIRRAL